MIAEQVIDVLQMLAEKLIEQRNKTIKEFAETEKWKKLLLK